MAPRKQKRNQRPQNGIAPKARLEKALRAYQSGKLMKAKDTVQALLKQKPDHMEGIILLARIYARSSDFDRSTKYLQRAIELAPENAELRVNLAEVAHQNGDRQLALDALQSAHEIDPTHQRALDGLSSLLFDEAKQRQSVELWTYARIFLERLCALDRTNVKKRWLLADCYEREGNPEKREQVLREIVALDPSDVTAPFLLAAAVEDELDTGDPEYARQVFDAAAENYDTHLVDVLKYQVPRQISELLSALIGSETSLGRVLDLGCGTGLVAEALHTRCHSLTGIDISEEMVEHARKKGHYTTLRVSELKSELAESRESFDIIIAADVLSYLGALDEIMTLVH